MKNLDIYCVTDKEVPFLEKSNYKLAGVGRKKFSEKYLRCDTHNNIYNKEKHYSELAFHYLYWKNKLDINNKIWIGFCQKRRFWITKEMQENINQQNINEYLNDISAK